MVTALAGGAVLIGARWFDLTLHVYLLVIAAIALTALVEMATEVHPQVEVGGLRIRFPLPLRRRPLKPRLRPLEALEHAVDFAPLTAFDVHYRLRPHLVRVAEQRLARRGLDPVRQPEAARAALGEPAWELIRPDRPRPRDRNQPGVSMAQIRATVESLERL